MEDLQQEEPRPEPNSSGSVSTRRARRSWATWTIDGLLLAIVFTGAWYAWPIQREAGRVHAKRMELQRIVGEMPIKRMASQGYASTGARDRFELQWHPLDRPLTLLRLRHSDRGMNINFNGKGPGIALWIEMKD